MPIQDDSLFRRLHGHARKRLISDPNVSRNERLPAYKRYLELESVMLKRQHQNGGSGIQVCQARAAMIDVIIENLFLDALDSLYVNEPDSLRCKIAILATGGYGRRELNPHSDIDIMFLYPIRAGGKAFEKFQAILAEEILYSLWDIGLKVGHASRNSKEVIEECRKEMHSKNAILESRIICGSEALYDEMRTQFDKFCRKENSSNYIQQRLEDEKARHAKWGDTIYLQEPDIKNGVGGLRDFQNILWMAHIKSDIHSYEDIVEAGLFRKDECQAIQDAYDFLLRTRTELHLQNKRSTDKLALEQQPTIAEQLKYPEKDIFKRVESFMKDYYSAARTIYRTSELFKERMALETKPLHKVAISSFREKLSPSRYLRTKKIGGFQIHKKTLSVDDPDTFEKDPVNLIRVFRQVQQSGAHIDPELRYLITRSVTLINHSVINSRSAAKSFRAILSTPGEVFPVLMQMHELGVLGRYLPEFSGLTCLVQHEYYHRYTADAHVLRTIRHLDRVFSKYDESYSRYEKEIRKNNEPLLLYLILLLHDIGKSVGIKDHAANGARMAKSVLNRFDVGKEQQEQILFVIENHLEMTRFWQRFDLDDPQTAASFATFIEDRQKLRFLYVHTYCDACGTAPTLWNHYKETMHRTLYLRTLEQFQDDETIKPKQDNQTRDLYQQLIDQKIKDISNKELEAHFNLLSESYFVNTGPADVQLHLRMVHQLLQQSVKTGDMPPPVIDWHDDIDLGITVVNVVTLDRAGLFYKLAGALTLAGANIISTKAISRKDKITIDTFYITDPDGGVMSDKKSRNIFQTRLNDTLFKGKELLPAINDCEAKVMAENKYKDILPVPFPPSIRIYYERSLQQTIIEVQANDRIGLLYEISRLISKRGFNIGFARIATELGVAMDTFYIETINDSGDMGTDVLLELHAELDNVVGKVTQEMRK